MPSDLNPIAGISNEKLKTLVQGGLWTILVLSVWADLYRTGDMLDRVEAENARQDARFLAIQERIFKAQDDLLIVIKDYKCSPQHSALTPETTYEPLTADEMDMRLTPRNRKQPLIPIPIR